ncbi:hypothetical protein AB1Y20_020614 [Prymnesium parvum]|uniref:Uncharacterized protein n=1 Tax=Prymnesium parvum TaxID=97485 RepID=A0AB34JV68_PRYPA
MESLSVRGKQLAVAIALIREREGRRARPSARSSSSSLVTHLQERIEGLLEQRDDAEQPLPSLRMSHAIVRWLEGSAGDDPPGTVAHGLQLLQTALEGSQVHWIQQPVAAAQLVSRVAERVIQAAESGRCEAPVVAFGQALCKRAALSDERDEAWGVLAARQQLLEKLARAYGAPILSAFAQTVRWVVLHAADGDRHPERTLLSTQPVFAAFHYALECNSHPPRRPEGWMGALQEAFDASWHLPVGCGVLKLAVWHLSMQANFPSHSSIHANGAPLTPPVRV